MRSLALGNTSGSAGIALEEFANRFGDQFRLSVLRSSLSQSDNQDMEVGLVRAIATVDEHAPPQDPVEQRFAFAAYYAQKKSRALVVAMLRPADYELLRAALAGTSEVDLQTAIYARLKRALPHALICVPRGDCFLLVLEPSAQDQTARSLKSTLDLAFDWPIELNGEPIELEMLCGLAQFPHEGDSLDTLSHLASKRLANAISV
jgi:hypothetical protein